jgi:hypothetical protein
MKSNDDGWNWTKISIKKIKKQISIKKLRPDWIKKQTTLMSLLNDQHETREEKRKGNKRFVKAQPLHR